MWSVFQSVSAGVALKIDKMFSGHLEYHPPDKITKDPHRFFSLRKFFDTWFFPSSFRPVTKVELLLKCFSTIKLLIGIQKVKMQFDFFSFSILSSNFSLSWSCCLGGNFSTKEFLLLLTDKKTWTKHDLQIFFRQNKRYEDIFGRAK